MTDLQSAVILAAGRGTRLRPLTDKTPKALLEIGGRPLLENTVNQIIDSGISKITFVVGHLGGQIEDHFGHNSEWHADFNFMHQSTLNGTGGALLLAEKMVVGSFLVVFGDSFFGKQAVSKMSQTTWEHAIGVVRVPDPSRYGIVDLAEDGRVKSVVEKPKVPKSNLAIAGLYKFGPEIWTELHSLTPSQRGELEIPDAVTRLIDLGKHIGAVALDFMADIGTHDDLVKIRRMVSRS